MNLVHAFLAQVAARPLQAAIVSGSGSSERTITFQDLDLLSRRVAGGLRSIGVAAGDGALVFVPMSVELYALLIALFRIGAVAQFIDPGSTPDRLAAAVDTLPPRLFAGIPRAHLLRWLHAPLRRIPLALTTGRWPLPGCVRWSALAARDPLDDLAPTLPDSPALVTFTSGSTGRPKAAVRSHGFLLAQHRVLEAAIRLQAGEVDLATLPVFVLANLASGLTSVIPDGDLRRPGAIDPGPVRSQIDRFRPTRCGASPAFYERLGPGGWSWTSLRSLYVGGAPVFPRTLGRLRTLAPGARIVVVYGSTEAEPIAEVAHEDISSGDLAAMRRGSGLLVGTPSHGTSVRILRFDLDPGSIRSPEDLDAATVPRGSAGEIAVSGHHVLQGYLGGVGDAETKLRVAGTTWHRTGDAGRWDASGRLWLLGRVSARIADSRGEAFPFAVEAAALELPGVRRAALLAQAGSRILAVETEPGATTPDPSDLPDARLDAVVRIDAMPLDPRHNAKIDYPRLRQQVEKRLPPGPP